MAGGDTNCAAIAFNDSRMVYCSSTHGNTRYNTVLSVVVVGSGDKNVESMRIFGTGVDIKTVVFLGHIRRKILEM